MGAIPGPAAHGDVHARVADTFRLEYARVVASVLRLMRDIDAAEEVVAAAEYRRALELAVNVRERAFYAGRLAACETREAGSPGETFRV